MARRSTVPRAPSPSTPSTSAVDVSMTDAEPPAGGASLDAADEDSDEEIGLLRQGVKILPGSTDTAASFEFTGEDHTLGNALRWIIMKNPAVEFCGYSIPHPSEPKMNVRVQTYEGGGVSASEALEKGLDDLVGLCDVVTEKFEEARAQVVKT